MGPTYDQSVVDPAGLAGAHFLQSNVPLVEFCT
jgi:hypothetical protein